MYTYAAEITKVVDADTLDLNVDLGFTVFTKIRIRLARIDAFETRLGKSTTEEMKAKGLEAKQMVKTLVETAQKVTVTTTGTGKYGRWIAELYIDGANLSDLLLSTGYAVEKSY